MASAPVFAPDVFNAREIARAAGVATGHVRQLIAAGQIASIDGRFVAPDDAAAAVRTLRGESNLPATQRELFGSPTQTKRKRGVPLAASGALHGAVVAVLAFVTAAGVTPSETAREILQTRMVFLVRPGLGGGGGGGGLGASLPPPPRGTAVRPVDVPLLLLPDDDEPVDVEPDDVEDPDDPLDELPEPDDPSERRRAVPTPLLLPLV
jgi:hypothetical protein